MLLTASKDFHLDRDSKSELIKINNMKINLIQGQFTKKEAISIITKMIDVKIRFHEDKIKNSDNEEDVKMRETRIKTLQKELYESCKSIESLADKVSVESRINIGE